MYMISTKQEHPFFLKLLLNIVFYQRNDYRKIYNISGLLHINFMV